MTVMQYDELIGALRTALARPLPGPAAQGRMAPVPRPGWRPGEYPSGAREGAVLLFLYPQGPARETHLILTVRTPDLPAHAGQVSLPGGAREPDETLEEAALREAEEEVGLPREAPELLGSLTPLHVPVSGFVLHPIVSCGYEPPSLVPHAGEVARILEVAVSELANPARRRAEERDLPNGKLLIPYFDVEGEKVWGATAMILSEFLTLAGHPPREQSEHAAGPTVLFLCSGNYYRSRFAEICFNARAAQRGLPWRAESRGLGPKRIDRPGPLAPEVVEGLRARGLDPGPSSRYPLLASEEDLRAADLVIAVREEEHRPLLTERFPAWTDRVRYWHVYDLDRMAPEEALNRLEEEVEALLRELA